MFYSLGNLHKGHLGRMASVTKMLMNLSHCVLVSCNYAEGIAQTGSDLETWEVIFSELLIAFSLRFPSHDDTLFALP